MVTSGLGLTAHPRHVCSEVLPIMFNEANKQSECHFGLPKRLKQGTPGLKAFLYPTSFLFLCYCCHHQTQHNVCSSLLPVVFVFLVSFKFLLHLFLCHLFSLWKTDVTCAIISKKRSQRWSNSNLWSVAALKAQVGGQSTKILPTVWPLRKTSFF